LYHRFPYDCFHYLSCQEICVLLVSGSYSGFDKEQPTSASGGKTKVAQLLKDNKGYQNLVFIGDGVTDLEASPPAVSSLFSLVVCQGHAPVIMLLSAAVLLPPDRIKLNMLFLYMK